MPASNAPQHPPHRAPLLLPAPDLRLALPPPVATATRDPEVTTQRLFRYRWLVGALTCSLTLAAIWVRYRREHRYDLTQSDSRMLSSATLSADSQAPLTPLALYARLQKELLSFETAEFTHTPLLSLGSSQWDPRPEAPLSHLFESSTWTQWWLAKAFKPHAPVESFDHLRYFGGVRAFGNLKQTLFSLASEKEGPLKSFETGICAEGETWTHSIDFDALRKKTSYLCDFASPQVPTAVFKAKTSSLVTTCVQTLSPGFYVLIPVTQRHQIWTPPWTAPDALVLEMSLGGKPTVHSLQTKTLRLKRSALETKLQSYSRDTRFLIFSIDSTWSPPPGSSADSNASLQSELRSIAQCESRLAPLSR